MHQVVSGPGQGLSWVEGCATEPHIIVVAAATETDNTVTEYRHAISHFQIVISH